MRYQADQKERTRAQILANAASLFRRDGIVATGVVGLMKSVGMTQGAFYAHFDSKEDLIREAAIAGAIETAQGMEGVAEAAGAGANGLKAVIGVYLSQGHLARVDRGCAIASIGSELVREPAPTRVGVMTATDRIVRLLESHLPDTTIDRRSVALSIFALMVGTLQLARLTVDSTEAENILSSGRKAALNLGGVGG